MLNQICIKDFKCHESIKFNINSNIFFIFGNNGSGKTSILESLLLLKASKVIMNSDLLNVIQTNKTKAYISTVFNKIFQIEIEIEQLDNFYKKTIYINKKKSDHKNISDIFEILMFSQFLYHDFIASKSYRRKWIDKICDFFFKEHHDDLIKCEKFLSHRMDILRNKSINNDYLDDLEIQIAKLYQIIILRRAKIADKINEEIKSKNFINNIKTKCFIESPFLDNSNSFKEMILSLYRSRETDKITKRNSSGINKDDFSIHFNCKDFKILSMGERKISLLKVFLSVISILSKKKFTIALIDELFSLLDKANIELILNELKNFTNVQIFVTNSSVIENITDKSEYLDLSK